MNYTIAELKSAKDRLNGELLRMFPMLARGGDVSLVKECIGDKCALLQAYEHIIKLKNKPVMNNNTKARYKALNGKSGPAATRRGKHQPRKSTRPKVAGSTRQ